MTEKTPPKYVKDPTGMRAKFLFFLELLEQGKISLVSPALDQFGEDLKKYSKWFININDNLDAWHVLNDASSLLKSFEHFATCKKNEAALMANQHHKNDYHDLNLKFETTYLYQPNKQIVDIPIIVYVITDAEPERYGRFIGMYRDEAIAKYVSSGVGYSTDITKMHLY